MKNTPDLQRGTTPASAKSPKRKKQGDVDDHDEDNNSTPKNQKRTIPNAKKMPLRAK